MWVERANLGRDLTALARQGLEPEVEADHLLALTSSVGIRELVEGVEYSSALKAGGSGVVLDVRDRQTGAHRAMKLPLSTAVKPIDVDPSGPVRVQLELAALSSVSHQNITRLFAGTVTDADDYCFIVELVTVHGFLGQAGSSEGVGWPVKWA